MKRTIVSALLISIFCALAAADTVALKNKEGVSINVTIVEASNDSVTVTRKAGKKFTIPFSKLSEESIKTIEEWKANEAREIKKKEDAINESLRPTFPENPKSPEELSQKVSIKVGKSPNNFATFETNGTLFIKPSMMTISPIDKKYFSINLNARGEKARVYLSQNLSGDKLKVRYIYRLKGESTYSTAKEVIVPTFEPHENSPQSGPKHLKEELPGNVEEIHFYDFRRDTPQEDATPENDTTAEEDQTAE